MIDGTTIVPGDVLIALPSSGLHTNGYSLARAIVFDRLGLTVDSVCRSSESPWATPCCGPHRSYLPAVSPLLDQGLIKGMAHITGGGIDREYAAGPSRGRGFCSIATSWNVPAAVSLAAAARAALPTTRCSGRSTWASV